MKNKNIKKRLEYLRGEIEKMCISYSEIAELQSLKDYIDKGDTLLLEWAGVPEFECEHKIQRQFENGKVVCWNCGKELKDIV